MGELRADWRLRLRREDAYGPVCGAGVLVDQCTALTCAHVVGRPDAVLWVEFAENSMLPPVRARVMAGGWLPERGDGEDVAVLRLESPRPQARPAPLDPGVWGGMEVYATGYADGFDDGMSLWGRIGGASGELVQLDAVTRADVVREGFSGAGVCTRPREDRPVRVVGLVVSWRGDLGAFLPEDNRLAFSYLIPVDRIARLSPLVAELSAPEAWDRGFEARVTRWFDHPDEDPVKITVVPPGGGKERSLRHLTHRADVVHRGGARTPDLIDHALGRIAFPAGAYLAYYDWLRGAGPRPAPAGGQTHPAGRTAPAAGHAPAGPAPAAGHPPAHPVTLLVDGLDEEPRPGTLIDVLERLRTVGFRLLLVFRREGGPGWDEACDRLLRPALLRHADALLDRLQRVELSRSVRLDVVDSASLGPVAETAERHRVTRRRIDEERDPYRQLARLRALIRALRADLGPHGGR
ncbi:serine protease [Streptomyces longwoodensis]|uniref:S1 family peptidase n=1 Tax=Streptomyces longwoodensis TaxID=68231 RepID=UPI002DD7C7EC|nr:serine protease [Streptomyces longwoodensis]WRY91187.1 serine protease [Streptomyces longwoodensis]